MQCVVSAICAACLEKSKERRVPYIHQSPTTIELNCGMPGSFLQRRPFVAEIASLGDAGRPGRPEVEVDDYVLPAGIGCGVKCSIPPDRGQRHTRRAQTGSPGPVR